MLNTRKASKHQSGFTVIELLVVLTITAILFGLASINLGKAQNVASLSSVTNSMIADIKNQQVLAMAGNVGSSSSAQPHGIYITGNSYTLFAGSTYYPSDSNNFSVNTNQVNLSTTFASSSLIFNKGDGTVDAFSSTNNTISLSEQGDTNVLTINRFGAITLN